MRQFSSERRRHKRPQACPLKPKHGAAPLCGPPPRPHLLHRHRHRRIGARRDDRSPGIRSPRCRVGSAEPPCLSLGRERKSRPRCRSGDNAGLWRLPCPPATRIAPWSLLAVFRAGRAVAPRSDAAIDAAALTRDAATSRHRLPRSDTRAHEGLRVACPCGPNAGPGTARSGEPPRR
jgi:hypothetical protein